MSHRAGYNGPLGSPGSRSKLEIVAEVRGGLHYPRLDGDFQTWFRTDADCLDYLEWLRWPHGFECGKCDGIGGWRTGDRRDHVRRLRAPDLGDGGTISDKTRTADRVVHGLLVVRHG